MIKAFSAILLVGLFNQSTSAATFELDTIQVDKQPAFTGEQIQQKLNNLVKSYSKADNSLRGLYFHALEKAGIDGGELVSAQEAADQKQQNSVIANCVRALLGSGYNPAAFSELRQSGKLDQFSDFVLTQGLKAKVSLNEAIDRATHHVVFGSDGIHNRRFVGTVHSLVLPRTLRNYENTMAVEKLVDAVGLHIAKFTQSPLIKLATAKNTFLTVNKIPTENYNVLKVYDVTVHTPCGYERISSYKLETAVILIVDAMAKLNAEANKLPSVCR